MGRRNQDGVCNAPFSTSEQAVDEGCEGGAFGQDEDQSEGQEKDDNRGEPPLLAHAQEAPEFSQDGKFSAHLKLLFVIAGDRVRRSGLPICCLVAFETKFKRALSAKALQEADGRYN